MSLLRLLSGGALRAALTVAMIAGVIAPARTRSAPQVGPTESTSVCPAPSAKVDLAFIIDRSGSMDLTSRGQTYNIQIEGVVRALRDPCVIPRDGSVAVAVFTFAGNQTLSNPLTEIKSAADAEAVAVVVERLRCDPPCSLNGPNASTECGEALLETNRHLNNQRLRSGARRVLLMSMDGGCTDGNSGPSASDRIEQSTLDQGITCEIDVILVGLTKGTKEFDDNSAMAKAIVFPEPTDTLPGAVLPIEAGDCNKPDASASCADHCRQVIEFAEHTRRVLRSHVVKKSLTVKTDADPLPGTAVMGDTFSLRQAIELANSNGGSTTITFDAGLKDKTIHPQVPLPALIAPEITICGCDENNCDPSITDARCNLLLTIDGSQTDTAKGEQHRDGILIRSNHCVVRGLRIKNFSRAGIAVDPICRFDNVGCNLIERNSLESNAAGVCVLDPAPGPANAVVHNVGNTISMNAISGSDPPIDLACDGRTPNDDGDSDEGPNTLLNYPEPFTADTSGNTVTITGKVNIPTGVCPTKDIAVVEVFAVTKIRPESGMALVDAATFFGKITVDENNGGAFSMKFTDGPVSPIDGYSATFTDRAGNTSELRPFCAGPPKPKLSTQSIKFKRVDPSGRPPGNPPSAEFTIENCGCSKLDLTAISIHRTGEDVSNGRIKANCTDDSQAGSGFLPIMPINTSVGAQGCPAVSSQKSDSVAIAPGECQAFRVEFKPVIPAVVTSDEERMAEGLCAIEVLPNKLTSVLTFNGGRVLPELRFIGRVTKGLKLIDPDTPSNPAKVTLTRSGDEFIVTFSVFDSNLDVNHLSFEFFDEAGRTVPLEIPEDNLTPVIQARKLVTGQSFIIIKRFSNAKQHPEVALVRVTVSDGQTSVSATSGPVGASTGGMASAQSLRDRPGAVLLLSIARLTPVPAGNAQGGTLLRPAVKLLNSSGNGALAGRSAIFKKGNRTQRNVDEIR